MFAMNENPFGTSEIHPNPPLSRRELTETTNTKGMMEFPLASSKGGFASGEKGGGGGFSLDIRRSELSPTVRSHADRLYAAIKNIYAKYGVTSVAELHAKIASGQKPKNLKSGELKTDSTKLSKLVEKLKYALEKNAVPKDE